MATLLLLAGWLAGNPERARAVNLIPWPDTVQVQPGAFRLSQSTVIVVNSRFANEAALLVDQFHLASKPSAETNCICLTTNGAEGLRDEAYRLVVNSSKVTICAHDSAGAFYGSETLKQLLEAQTGDIPCVEIEDAPHYAWRGLMLDVSRHFFDKSTVLTVLDWMASYKLNRLHLHLTDDQGWRMEIPNYPELTRKGGRGNYSDSNAPASFFTQSDLREVIKFAAQRHIVVVPEIDMPGHASAATRAYPQLDGGMHTFNPASEATYDFLDNVLCDVMKTFPSPWIHFGGDEVNYSQWNVSDQFKAQGITRPDQLEAYFVRRIAAFISQHGRTPVGWDEVVATKPVTNTVIFWWRHNKPEALEEALAEGYSVVLTPRTPCYFDYPQDHSYPKLGWNLWNTPEVVYGGPKIPADISAAERQHILGVEACVWTEHISTVPYLDFMLLPRMAALSEMAWTPDNERNYEQFNARLQPFLENYRRMGIRFYDAGHPRSSWRLAMEPATNSVSAD